ncbi:MAG: ATP-dependent RNA helicase RhlE [Myxococcota bacterium]|jgi:ATP-dependent RNA helicase RhlE
MGLAPEVLTGLSDMGFSEPTPIQSQAIPLAMVGRDLIASASTGTGKTAAFLVPILHQLAGSDPGTLRVVVLTPTRELALQIDEQALALGYHVGFSSVAVIGGMKMAPQEDAIRSGAEIIVATPGRLIDHLRFPHIDPSGVQYLVIDEADRMFDMGFLPDVNRIVARLPKARQTLLFSATMPPKVRKLADSILVDPETIAVNPSKPAKGLKQRAFSVAHRRKSALLSRLVEHRTMKSVIVFVKRKREADGLARTISRMARRKTQSIHSGRSQQERIDALEDFRTGAVTVLVATDVAARGIDVDSVTHVFHFDVPRSSDDYIHRSGRTGRAGQTGQVMTFVAPDEESDMASIERAIGMKIPRVKLKGFNAGLDGASSRPAARPAGRRRRT